jgi:methionyl-tRNA formyltransferase
LNRRFILFAMSERGVAVLRAILDAVGTDPVAAVVIQRDGGVERDYSREIASTAESAGIPVLTRDERLPPHAFSVAVAWRFMIYDEPRLIVFHDSLLPRYRGFAPIVNALINGEPEIGVTALWGNDRYDSGPIIDQAKITLSYPLTIRQAIEMVLPLYRSLAASIIKRLLAGECVSGDEQDESRATYSTWRDAEDYRVDWTRDAAYIVRFIDAVGSPYKGACSHFGLREVRILRAEAERTEVPFEIRHPGKVFSIDDGVPTVICGEGLVRLLAVSDAKTGDSLLPWIGLRTRFCDR